MVVVLDLAKDRGVDPGHGGRIQCGWWRFGASSDCSGRHHPRRWQLILNVVRELLLSKGQKHILLNLGNVNYIDMGVKESFVSEGAPFTQTLSDPRTAFREEVARGYGSPRCECV